MAFNLGDIFVTFKGKAEGFAQVVSTVQGAAKEVQGVTDKIGKAGDKSVQVGKTMSLALTTPIVGFGVAAFKSSADFERTMNQVSAATGEPADKMKELRDLAMKMGADTAYSAGEAGDAMLELAKGGLTAAQIKAGGLQATMTLAAAGGISLANAAGYVSNALNTFNLDATQAGSVAAALAGGANASTASVESLGMALSQVGPGAKLAGYSLQDTVAVLAAFDNAGVKGSDAGTSLKTMLMNLVPQTKSAADEMARLGLKFTDANGKFLPLRDIAQQLQTKLKGLSESQKQNALTTMFGTDAYRAAAILMQNGAEGIDKYTAATNDQNAAQKMADQTMAGSAGAMERMMGSIETAVQKAGDVIAPTVVKIMNKVGEWADKFGALPPKAQEVILIVGAIVAAIGPLLIILGMMAKGISMVSTAITFLAMNPAMIGWTLAIMAIAGLAYLIISNWDTLKKWFSDFWGWLQGIAGSVGQWFTDGFNTVKDAAAAALDFINQKWAEFMGWVDRNKQALINIGIVITTLLLPKLTQIAIEAAKAGWAMVVNASKSGAAWVASAAQTALAWAKTIPGLIAGQARAGGSAVVNAVKAGAAWVAQAARTSVAWARSFGVFALGMAKMVGQFLLQAGRMALGWLLAMGPLGLIVAAVAGVVALIIANWDTVKVWLEAFWNWIVGVAETAWQLITAGIQLYIAIWMAIFQAIGDFLAGIWNWIKNAAIFVWQVITTAIQIYIQIWMTIFQAIGNFIIGIWNWIQAAAAAVWNWITDFINGAVQGWKNIIGTVVGFIQGVFQNAINIVRNIWGGIAGWFGSVIDGIRNTFGNIVNIVSGPFKAAFNAIAGFWNNSIGNLKWKAPDWIPGIGGKEIGVPKLPMLAQGGIASRATLAMIGEGSEPEAVIPLSKIGQVAAQMGATGGGGESVMKIEAPFMIARSDTELADLFEQGIKTLDRRRKANGKKPIL